MSAFTAISLDRLPAPQIIAQPSFEAIFQARKARLLELDPSLAGVLELESEPLVILLQEDSYRELLLRAAVQDAGRGNLLAYASGAVLEHLAGFYGITRQVVTPADPDAVPPVEEVRESDDRLRARVQLAPEGFTTAGSEGSYHFWALTASPAIADVSVLETATPGEVRVVVLSSENDGVPSSEILDAVESTTQERRPLTDRVFVEAASIITYSVEAELTLYSGPDASLVKSAAQSAVDDFVLEHFKLGHDITRAGLVAALYREGVQNVNLAQPAGDIVVAGDQAARCLGAAVTVVGRDV